MDIGSEFFRSNFTYIAEIYLKYKKDSSSVDISWRELFSSLSEDEKVLIQDMSGPTWNPYKNAVVGKRNEFSSLPLNEIKDTLAIEEKKKKDTAVKTNIAGENILLEETQRFIENFRKYGHLAAKLDPLELRHSICPAELQMQNYNLNETDLEKSVSIMGEALSISSHIEKFQKIYCGFLGIEASHIQKTEERDWLYHQMEEFTPPSNIIEIQKLALESLLKAELFENTLHTKFTGAKRFSLEGGESVIVALENILIVSSENDVEEINLGMAHRGRLNILTHILEKPYHAIFSEFAGVSSIPLGIPGSGDVKYHLGFSRKRLLSNGKTVKLVLMPNPSHLEAVNPVVLGKTRAKQDLKGDVEGKTVLPILIHGDAAVAGQGIVAECLAMANLEGYKVGGTIHIVINNQVGFTAVAAETKSSTYCTDVGKMIECPIFHVNGNDVDSVIKASIIIARYRQRYGKDAFLEIVCYRKYGHNEGDEPMFTQPIMYNKIKQMPLISSYYSQELLYKGVISNNFENAKKNEIKAILENEFEKSKVYKPTKADWMENRWSHIKRLENEKSLLTFEDTMTSQEMIDTVGGEISKAPKDFALNPKIAKLLQKRQEMMMVGDKIDWATAELLAYGTLLLEGYNVRLSGEDCERGTFSHRHSVYYDQNTNKKFYPLNNLPVEKAGKYQVYNSPLSEYGVLGYEYGYSLGLPDTLTIWEAQYGDFSNGAAIIYDQFISASEDKWLRMSGVVSFLPHGFEGQGPEHSSARLERFLAYCAQNNIIICNITTPANLFHVLRRQVKMPFRKPLIIMYPKSLLRHEKVTSHLNDFKDYSFRPIIGEKETKPSAKRIIFTSGKIYYDLIEEREKNKKQQEIAVIRIEQYYPFDKTMLKNEISRYKETKEFIWLQEEPKNMGAWNFIRDYLEELCGKIRFVGRAANPSPATGFGSAHAAEQKQILTDALK